MKALVYHGPGKKAWEEKPKPIIIEPTDVIVKILNTTICGTDLHIVKGDVPSVETGRTLGHEGVGIIEIAGKSVVNFKTGDHVIISCITSCGVCEFCKKSIYSHCVKGGWILGNTIDGTQAEYVRIPFADNSLYHIPEGADEKSLVMLSDILPTGFECGVLNGKVKPGDTIAIVGVGPVGLAVLLTAQFFTPFKIIVIDLDDHRLELAKSFGATHIINNADIDPVKEVMRITNNRGIDVVIEAVGLPRAFELCEKIVGTGGYIANIGVHGKSVALHLETLWSKNITITTRLVDTGTTPMLLESVKLKKIDPKVLITHHFKLDEILEAYRIFDHSELENTLKVILST